MDWSALPLEQRQVRALGAVQDLDDVTLADLLEHHLSMYGKAGADTSAHTIRSYQTALRLYLAFLEAREGISSLPPEERTTMLLDPGMDRATAFLRSLQREKKKPATINARRAAIAEFYAALRWTRITTASPFSDVPGVRDPTPAWDRRAPYSPEDIRALTHATADPIMRTVILLGAQGGLRAQDILSLKWASVNLPKRQLRIERGKGGKSRPVGIPKTLAAALDELQDAQFDGEFVIPVRTQSALRRRLLALCKTAGVEYRALHCLRHHAGTEIYRRTHDLNVVASQLGHSNINTSRIYAKLADDSLDNAIKDWES